jgi:hypothetical protein
MSILTSCMLQPAGTITPAYCQCHSQARSPIAIDNPHLPITARGRSCTISSLVDIENDSLPSHPAGCNDAVSNVAAAALMLSRCQDETRQGSERELGQATRRKGCFPFALADYRPCPCSVLFRALWDCTPADWNNLPGLRRRYRGGEIRGGMGICHRGGGRRLLAQEGDLS